MTVGYTPILAVGNALQTSFVLYYYIKLYDKDIC